ncbi:RNA polymerase, alpha subunit, C-terminal [uncultured Caudovirales phage]|uniref:RNA polymerase, alpha subunit, C-terminal n=1 Tax=uncultured Caudovirales phage TaxID=2100421 RepID=A0A6J5M7I6_9CAUD|nr:RNA polymerase, alpha subunit, C-terminal [uncultured Caudovirales phage]
MSTEILETKKYGWLCPCCSRVFSPTVKMCSFCLPNTDVKFDLKKYDMSSFKPPHEGRQYVGNTRIEVLDLDVRTINCLKCGDIFEVEQLCFWTQYELAMIPNLGKKSLNKLLDALKEVGITLEKYPKGYEHRRLA